MGVNTFLLDRRSVTLLVGGKKQMAGTLRRFFKLTELDEERHAEVEAAERDTYSPPAAMIMDVNEGRLADDPDRLVNTHLVLGWDEGRGTVTDYKWDYLPVLGYAVRNPGTAHFTLYEEKFGLLYPIDGSRARELGLIDDEGKMVRRGQPVITSAANVRPFLDRYADADCVMSNGATETMMTIIEDGQLPPADWFVGKRPMDVKKFAAARGPEPS